MKAWTIYSTLGIGLLALAGYIVYSHHKADVATELAQANLPAMPDVADWPEAFQVALRSAHRRVEEGSEPVQALGRLSEYYHANGFLEEARICYGGLVQLEPEEPRWFHRLADIVAGYGYLDEALPLWERVMELDADFLPARVRHGDALLKLGRWDEAAQALDAALKKWPEDPHTLMARARVEMAKEDWSRAREYLEQSARHSNYRVGVDLLAMAYEELDMDAEMRNLLRSTSFGAYADLRDPWIEALLPFCFDADRLATAGGTAAWHNDFDTAIALLKRALKLEPNDAYKHYQLGELCRETGRLTLAGFHLRESVELDPGLSDGWLRLIFMAEARRDFGQAQELLFRGLQHCPDSPALHSKLGDHYSAIGNYEEAIEAYREAARLRPNEARAFILLSKALFGLDRVEDGVAAMQDALVAEPDNPVALTTMTFYAIKSGQQAEARDWIRRIRNEPKVPLEDVQRLETLYAESFSH